MLPKMEAATAWSLFTNKESQVGVEGEEGGSHATIEEGRAASKRPH
jgi:hypothetical protein